MNHVEIRSDEVPPLPWLRRASAFVKKTLDILGVKNLELSVLICGNKYIKTLNARYRNKDEATDVLSFPMEEPDGIPLPSARRLAGDIVISLDALKENAGFFKVAEDEELRRLLVHGTLHLLGYDHATNRKDEPMLEKQEEILSLLKNEEIGLSDNTQPRTRRIIGCDRQPACCQTSPTIADKNTVQTEKNK